MSTPSAKPAYVTLHRLGELSGRSRNTLLLRMRDDELLADATLDVGGTPQPLFLAQRVAELKRLPSRKAARAVKPPVELASVLIGAANDLTAEDGQ